ncbi:MAG: transposase, partial [Gammaproteobacteria bacterium]|nr:transposase [Gammaproteobacteria bacterium]
MPPPTKTELDMLLERITTRIARHLERRGLLVRDTESSHLSREPGEDAGLEALQGHLISYRIALGPHEGRKAFALQTLPARRNAPVTKPHLANAGGFSLHAGVAVRAGDRGTLERLSRYITRPALATGRLALTPQGQVRYTLKTPYRDGTTPMPSPLHSGKDRLTIPGTGYLDGNAHGSPLSGQISRRDLLR